LDYAFACLELIATFQNLANPVLITGKPMITTPKKAVREEKILQALSEMG